MDKKVVFGIAAVLAVVTVAVVVAVLVTGTEVTSKPQNETESMSNKTLEIKEGPLTGSTGPPGPTDGPTDGPNTGPEGPGSSGPSTGPTAEPGSTDGPFTGSTTGHSTGPTTGHSTGPTAGPTAGPDVRPPQEVFMQTNNGFHGGVVIKVGNEVQKVIGYNIVGKHAVGVNKTLRMETLAGASVSGDVLQLGEISYERHTISPDIPSGSKLRPGLYASRLGGETTTGWYDEAAETKLGGDSMGILSFSYKGPTFVGVKLVGDTYVPAGEESTRVNTTDGAAEVKWASPGYQSPNWKPSKLDPEENMNGQGHFTIITSSGNKEYFTEFVHLDEMVEVDAGVAVRFAHLPSPLASEGP